MIKRILLALTVLLCWSFGLSAQTNYTDSIVNPGFETGNANSWIWSGTSGYAWLGPNTDGDGSKEGSYINGLWNSTIGDAECAQLISGLPEGYYKVTALVTVSKGRLTNQRLFASSGSVTKAMLYGQEAHPAYSAANLAILEATESISYGGFAESSAENGPFHKLSVVNHVTNDSIKIGIRVSGKSTSQAYDFSHTSNGDAGFFKFDGFTLTEVSDVATLDNISLNIGFLDAAFDPLTYEYSATLPQGTEFVTPIVKSSVEGTEISGTGPVDLSSGTATSTMVVTALDGSTQKTYVIHYELQGTISGNQQDKLYSNEYPLGDVTLLEGPFKHAQELNIQHLLAYDVDRLLAPYRKEAGLSAKASSYPNWIGLDGHIGGHYLSAMAMNYAGTGDENCRTLMNYMVDELKACQDANAIKYPNWGLGYAGGVPSSNNVWSNLKNGSFNAYNTAWVPWYNLHKTYAGLRDAWLYGGNETAKDVFLEFCDWAIEITAGLSNSQMEVMLDTEHGGMNEVLADAFQMTGETKYIDAAKRFSHKDILNSMAISVDNLDNRHANTQVPKAVGFQRVAELTNDVAYVNAAKFFWQTVVEKRSLALGGNSRKEYFPESSASMDYIHDVEGPESCNTNNMLKLTEHLFRTDPQAKYADYYERALYNHILSTQHPEHGGYVYFTPARPQHYRVYSAPNQAMWCCVGTGMENHGKYGEFIYTHNGDDLYLNLFIASELKWKEKGITVRQETNFPEEEQSSLFISADAPTDFTLMLRSPHWAEAGSVQIIVNTDTLNVVSVPQSYIPVQRTWNDGDKVKIILPMHNSIEPLPNLSRYVALLHGPILLGAKTGTEDLFGLIADDSRWGHIAGGSLMATADAPVIVSQRDSIINGIIPIKGEPMHFTAEALFPDDGNKDLVLEPFYKIHDARYMMYWMALNEDQYQNILDSLAEVETAELELEARTIDKVAPGEQQPEADHNMHIQNSNTGNWQNEFWRDATNGGFISYAFQTFGKSDLSLMVRYWGNETYGSRTFDILIDGEKLTTENLIGKWNINEFVNVEYPIPNAMIKGKETITVKFQAISSGNIAGGLFYVRILQPEGSNSIRIDKTINNTWKAYAIKDMIVFEGLDQGSKLKIFNVNGQLLYQRLIVSNNLSCSGFEPGMKLITVISDRNVGTQKVMLSN